MITSTSSEAQTNYGINIKHTEKGSCRFLFVITMKKREFAAKKNTKKIWKHNMTKDDKINKSEVQHTRQSF